MQKNTHNRAFRSRLIPVAFALWSSLEWPYSQALAQIREEAQSWLYELTPLIVVDRVSRYCSEPIRVHGQGCVIPGLGTMTVDRSTGQLSFQAARPLTIHGLGWEGQIPFPDAQSVLSNGFHSWSHSGIIAAGPELSPKEIIYALDVRHDEFRNGKAFSWEYGLIGNRDRFLFAGATSAHKWKTWVQFARKDHQNINVRIMSGGTGEELVLDKNEAVSGESWVFESGSLEQLGQSLNAYGNLLAGPHSRHESRASNVPLRTHRLGSASRIGWNSWYNLWTDVEHRSFADNVSLAAPYLSNQFTQVGSPTGTPVAVLDDGWSVSWGDWRPNEKFSEGLTEVARHIEAQGMEPGIWIAPWLVAVESPLVQEKPSWFVATEDFSHPSGKYKILDTTHPEVAEYLRVTIKRLVDHGFKYLKLDFLYTGTFEGRRFKPVTAMESFVTGMKLIREAAGPHVTLAACGAPGLAVRPYVDSWRTGPDIAYQFPSGRPAWADVALQIQNLSARWFLCRSMRCDVDPLLVRGPRRIEEVHAALWAVALGAGGFFVSDDFRQLEAERKGHMLDPIALDQAVSEIPARPDPILPLNPVPQLITVSWMDRLFDRNFVRPPVQWLLPSGKKVTINTTEQTIHKNGVAVPKRTSLVE